MPALCLDVDFLEAETIEGNNAVDAGVARCADMLEIVGAGAVAECVEEIEDQLFEEGGRRIENAFQKVASDGAMKLVERGVDALVGAGLCGSLSEVGAERGVVGTFRIGVFAGA